MPAEETRAPLTVYMLADHLDAALAAGEDLVARGQDWRALAHHPGEPQALAANQRSIAQAVQSFELMVVARILKARDHARALSELDPRFGPVANLFASGTAILLDAVEECGDARENDFETGDSIIAYIRSRGLIAPDAADVMHPSQLTVDENFLVAKRIALGPLMDMTAVFLDALDGQYELFIKDVPDDEDLPAPAGQKNGNREERLPLN